MMSVVIATPLRARRIRSDQIEILFRGVRAVHRFQDFVRAGLQRQMNVLGKFR